MKKTMTILAVFLLVCTSGCNNDDSENTSAINENNADFIFTQAIVINYGTSEQSGFDHEGYNLDLTLLSSGVNINFITEESSGTGNGLYFEMFSTEQDGYPSGTYTFNTTEPLPTGSFAYGELCNECDFNSNDLGTNLTEVTGGSVAIEKSGNRYTISAEITNEAGETFTGFFEGTLSIFDERDALNAKGGTYVLGNRKK